MKKQKTLKMKESLNQIQIRIHLIFQGKYNIKAT